MTGAELVSVDDIRTAAKRLQDVAVRTPLVQCDLLSEAVGAEVRLKCESLQRAGSFKIRGAYNYISQLDPTARDKGVVAYSSGNHGQGVALAARLLGTRATIVMPTTALAVKQEGARHLGAEVILEGTTSITRRAKAEAIARERGLPVVPGFDHPHIVAGQGTVGLEIAEQWPDVDTVLVPIGGGGLVSGMATVLKNANQRVRIIGVEPTGARSMALALTEGAPVTIPVPQSIADGLTASRVSDLTLAHARHYVDDVIDVTDDAIRAAAAFLLKQAKLVVEFSGAATVAALLSGVVRNQDRRVVAVISGGNIDVSQLHSLLT